MTFEKVLLALGLAALMGCGRLEETPGETNGGAGDPSTDPTSPVATPPPPAVAATRRAGSISMTSGGGTFRAYADFPLANAAPVKPRGATCQIVTRGENVEPSESAGKIVIEVPSRSGPTTATLAFDAAKKSYEPAVLEGGGADERLEKANAPIRVRAGGGGGVPAFEVDVPSAFDAQLIEPAADAVVSEKSGDVAVRWSDGGNDSVFVILTIVETAISCRFEASAGKGVIPSALVQQAFAQPSNATCQGDCVSIGLISLRGSTVAAGDYDIFVSHALTSFHALRSE